MDKNKIALGSLAMDLKRVALGYYRNSTKVAEIFMEEALKRKKELNLNLVSFKGVYVFIKTSKIIELYITKKEWLKKIVLRSRYNTKKDIIFVIELFPFSMKAKIITLWLNNKKDKHYTLDKTKYNKL